MRILKPPRLKTGDVIGICAPAGPLSSAKALQKGIAYLEQLGYRVHLAKNLFRKRGYLAGTERQRVADLHELFGNRYVKAIFAARGGFGTQRLLPLLDYRFIRRHPKIVVGYSDITALQLSLLAKAGLASLSAPLVAEMPLQGGAEEHFWRLLTSSKRADLLRPTDAPNFRRSRGRRAHGLLLGGNLSLFSAIAGSPFFPKISQPLFFLEEVNEQPYRIDRSLQQLVLNGVFHGAQGVVLGSFTGCTPEKKKPSLTLRQIFHDAFWDFSFPVVSGIHYGHVRGSFALPIGVHAMIPERSNQLKLIESPVS